MVFPPDVVTALLCAADLVNSLDDPDSYSRPSDVVEFYERHGYTGRVDGNAAELAQVRALRLELRELLLADRDDAVSTINEWLFEARAVPQLVRHDDLDWHIHGIADDAPIATRIRVETAIAMIDVIRSHEQSRIRVCASENCQGLAVDLSRNRSKRFCTAACGNRIAAAAYRARQL